jgi:acetylornithine deacetylase/succinyl-diaminopimelate desuccinylase-like protein
VGSTTVAAEAMAKRLRDAGFPAADIVVMGPEPRHGNMVARLHGSGVHKPVLLIGHLDVVEAKRSDWTKDPFQFIENDGYYYGRGTQDMKDGDAIRTRLCWETVDGTSHRTCDFSRGLLARGASRSRGLS